MADLTVAAETCVALGATEHQFIVSPAATSRSCVNRHAGAPGEGEAPVGPWSSRPFRSADVCGSSPMDVGAHPHMGLQTVTWLSTASSFITTASDTNRCFEQAAST